MVLQYIQYTASWLAHLVVGSAVAVGLNMIGLVEKVLLLQMVSVQVRIGTVCTNNQSSSIYFL
jgi:hypothetical protein